MTMMPFRPRPRVDPFGVEALGAENMGLLGPPAPVYPPEPPADVMTGQSVAPSPAAAPLPSLLAARAAPALRAATAHYAPRAPADTLLGLQGEALRIGSQGTLADLTANIAEQRALATAQERADAASANAAVAQATN